MLVYFYDSITKEYVGCREANMDKKMSEMLGKVVYFKPASSTYTEPSIKVAPEGKAIVYNRKTDSWDIVEDHRGEVIYNIDTRTGQVWTELGEIPTGYTTKLMENLIELKDTYLKDLKTNFNMCLTTNKVSPTGTNLYFTYDSLERLQNELSTGIYLSRDDNNKIYNLTKDELAKVIDFMVVYGQYMYLQKWILENAIKKCDDINLLKSYKSSLEFKVNTKQIENIVSLTEEQRQAYFNRLANSIQ